MKPQIICAETLTHIVTRSGDLWVVGMAVSFFAHALYRGDVVALDFEARSVTVNGRKVGNPMSAVPHHWELHEAGAEGHRYSIDYVMNVDPNVRRMGLGLRHVEAIPDVVFGSQEPAEYKPELKLRPFTNAEIRKTVEDAREIRKAVSERFDAIEGIAPEKRHLRVR